jgi:hypothetical protein
MPAAATHAAPPPTIQLHPSNSSSSTTTTSNCVSLFASADAKFNAAVAAFAAAAAVHCLRRGGNWQARVAGGVSLGSSVLSLLSSLNAQLLRRGRAPRSSSEVADGTGVQTGQQQAQQPMLAWVVSCLRFVPKPLLAHAARMSAACLASARKSGLRTLATMAVGMWALSVRLHNASVVDVSWALLFTLQASVYMLHSSAAMTSPARKTVAWAATMSWALRLSSFLWWRNHQSVVGMGVGGQAHAEDFRYQAFRKWVDWTE